MINTPQATSEKKQRSRFFSSVVLTGTTLLFLLQPGFSKNSEKVKLAIKETLESYDSKDYTLQENQTINTSYNFQQAQNTTQGSNDALSFASNKVNLYYPDMKDHLATMIKSFRDQEHQDATIVLLNKMAANITDPKQKTGAII